MMAYYLPESVFCLAKLFAAFFIRCNFITDITLHFFEAMKLVLFYFGIMINVMVM